MAVINPYSGINLANAERILSVSHQHLSHTQGETGGITYPQKVFNDIYATGVRHFAISRYRPSIPSYPFDYANNKFPYVCNPFAADDDLQTLKSKYTVQIDMPNDVIGSPNAEHINPTMKLRGKAYAWTVAHINAVGSMYESGTIPGDDGYKNVKIGAPYSDAISAMLDALQYTDGGGVIINHAKWTHDELVEKRSERYQYDVERFIRDCLDLDSRVLGTDIIEGGRQDSLAYDTALIDSILSTGRRCWIFCQGDWGRTRGRNELLIQPPAGATRAEKEYYCLKAYRDGAFFGRYANSNLSISSVTFDENTGEFSITAPNADGIFVVVDGVSTGYREDAVTVTVPLTAKYVRAMAYKDRDNDPDWEYQDGDIYKDIVFTNPIMINPATFPYDPAYDFDSGDDTDPDDDDSEDEDIPDQTHRSRFKAWYYG